MQGKYVVKYFRELDKFTFKELKRDLMNLLGSNISDDEITTIITILKNKRIIIQYRSQEEKGAYKNNFNYESFNYDMLDFSNIDSNKEQVFTIKYVGIIIIKNYIFKCLPKYIASTVSMDIMNRTRLDKILKKVINVLQIYNSRQEIILTATNSSGYEDFNLLDMAIYFINDYIENDIYSNEHNLLELNGNGNVDWNNTIEGIYPILSNRGPVYLDLCTECIEVDKSNFFRKLHLCIIAYCISILDEANLFDILSIENICDFNFDSDINSLGDDEFILEEIHKEMNIQFITRKLNLLEKMNTFISKKNSLNKEYQTSLYGTSNFNTVWENICKVVFDNKLDTKVKNLPFQEKLNYNNLVKIRYNLEDDDKKINEFKNMRLKQLIEKPLWHINNSNEPHEANKTYIPDSVQVYEKDNKLNFTILDAKYMDIILVSNVLKNAPGVEEITKQYLYQLVFKDLFDSYTLAKEKIEIKNIFLFPADCDDIVKFGFTEIKMLKNFNLENIEAIKLPADKMYDYYINNIKIKNIEDIY